MEHMRIAPVVTGRTKMEISVGAEDAASLRRLALRYQTSPAILAQLAVRNMLDQDRDGCLPPMPKFEVIDEGGFAKEATHVTRTGPSSNRKPS